MKEIIIAECDGDDTIHCCRYEQEFDYDNFMITIFTKKVFPQGKVKITIETITDEELKEKETMDFYKAYHKFATEQRKKGR